MRHTEQHTNQQRQARNLSVLDGRRYIAGLPSGAKSLVQQARDDKGSDACKSVFDGLQCIDGC
jgi:hypothetical protein